MQVLEVGMRVSVVATGAVGVIVEIFPRHRSVDVDLGDGVTAEFGYDEVAVVDPGGAGPSEPN
jgi:hypothetical protein